ncbi:catalase [Terrabacter tumescens]|uniref:Catalase n=1 Tax=Terrabacter tumescens TaxID=60443 RepID=A0ABQ2HWU9_9MICO|nr:catalase [Terrabacter tumescens]GGM94020.1 catalase [Terrabacter tumescens]
MEEPRTPPSVDEPTTPQEPLEPQPDQAGPEVVSATGKPTGAPPTARSQSGAYLTTSQGLRLKDTDHSLKAGRRGPTLLEDHHLREKITHFDHERIPERVVHARGSGAHGVFRGYGTAASVCRAGLFAADVETPVFVRFSTVLGSRGSADTVRDTRGFAVKFYTDEGTFDLVGNNMPVFFIQDGIKFPDVVHAAKPHPDREIPQAQSAHDTFWDFVSLHTEAQHHTMWNMSDRGIQASFRTMEGFGVHTFRLVDWEGATTLVKFHWKPKAGVHSLVWEEAQLAAGGDPDFHRRDLADAIEAGFLPQWELGIQTFPDEEDETFEGIDLLDPTKLVPEELAPVQPIGLMTLTANPSNFFAETEQVAFHGGNLVPGVEVTNDPLLQARLFSYVDTQLTRLGGPNFNQIPVNRPHAPVNDMLRDGFHQHAVHTGVAPYRPNSLDGGCPFTAGEADGAFVQVPAQVAEGQKVRAAARSFDDHFSQARLFYRSMSPVEQDHIKAAYSFELAKCYELAVRQRQLQCLANIDGDLCGAVAQALGMVAPAPTIELVDAEASRALSQVGTPFPVEGRKVGIVVDAVGDTDLAAAVVDAVTEARMVPFVVGPHGGMLDTLTVARTYAVSRSFELDAVVVVSGAPARDAMPGLDARAGEPQAQPVADAATVGLDPRIALLLGEMWRHCKVVASVGEEGDRALAAAGIPGEAPGVVRESDPQAVVTDVAELLALHRVWDRFTPVSG